MASVGSRRQRKRALKALADALEHIWRSHRPSMARKRLERTAVTIIVTRHQSTAVLAGVHCSKAIERETHLARVTSEPPSAASSSGLPRNASSQGAVVDHATNVAMAPVSTWSEAQSVSTCQ